jgi:Flp pilus assembly protein TadG
MRWNRKSFVRDSRGQSLVEFALILPMMLVVMFMITEFGRAIYQFNVLTQATREGVRAAVVADAATAEAVGAKRMNDFLTLANMKTGSTVTCTIVHNFNGANGVTVVQATADKPFNWAFKGPMTMQGGASVSKGAKAAWTLHGESVMQSETFK